MEQGAYVSAVNKHPSRRTNILSISSHPFICMSSLMHEASWKAPVFYFHKLHVCQEVDRVQRSSWTVPWAKHYLCHEPHYQFLAWLALSLSSFEDIYWILVQGFCCCSCDTELHTKMKNSWGDQHSKGKQKSRSVNISIHLWPLPVVETGTTSNSWIPSLFLELCFSYAGDL